jgi:catechol 2,3-dioxygenase
MINQLSFTVQSLDELKAMYARIKQAGVSMIKPVNHGCAWSIYFPDPEGNMVEIYLDTPWYVRQPHGDPLNLDLPSDEIVRQTKEMCESDPTFMPAAEWQKNMHDALASN